MTPTHETATYEYEDYDPTHDISTWHGWTCTCGDGGDGVGPSLAEDLAYMHRERTAPCSCGTPTITNLHTFPTPSFALTCACGYDRIYFFPRNPYTEGRSAYQCAKETLAAHTCRRFPGHPCTPGEATYIAN